MLGFLSSSDHSIMIPSFRRIHTLSRGIFTITLILPKSFVSDYIKKISRSRKDFLNWSVKIRNVRPFASMMKGNEDTGVYWFNITGNGLLWIWADWSERATCFSSLNVASFNKFLNITNLTQCGHTGKDSRWDYNSGESRRNHKEMAWRVSGVSAGPGQVSGDIAIGHQWLWIGQA